MDRPASRNGLSASRGEQADRLTAAELRELISDKTWAGRNRNGTDFIQYFDNAGTTAYRSANTSITGEAEIREDRLCERFEGYFLDHMACGYVYRNTTMDQPDADYIHVSPQAIKFFSLLKGDRTSVGSARLLPAFLQLFRYQALLDLRPVLLRVRPPWKVSFQSRRPHRDRSSNRACPR